MVTVVVVEVVVVWEGLQGLGCRQWECLLTLLMQGAHVCRQVGQVRKGACICNGPANRERHSGAGRSSCRCHTAVYLACWGSAAAGCGARMLRAFPPPPSVAGALSIAASLGMPHRGQRRALDEHGHPRHTTYRPHTFHFIHGASRERLQAPQVRRTAQAQRCRHTLRSLNGRLNMCMAPVQCMFCCSRGWLGLVGLVWWI